MFRSTIVRASYLIKPHSPVVFISSSSSTAWGSHRHLCYQMSPKLKPNTSIIPQLGEYRHCNLIRYPVLQQVKFLSNTLRSLKYETRDEKREEEVRDEKLRVDPDSVSSTSTVTPIFGNQKTSTPANEADEVDMLEGLTSDLKTVRDTFRLEEVPREVFYIGMAGLVPYVATTVSTLYLAWETKYSSLHGVGYLVDKDTAQSMLHFLEALQVGYGAVILSFLGAIHWGLEFAGYGGRKSFQRYAIGLIAPALAWPTILFPLHEALLTQFIGFTGMYFFDTSATTAGLAPPWYSTYRFVLTLVVGASIVLTLIGRGKIGDDFGYIPSPIEHLRQIRVEQRRNVEKEQEERLMKLEVGGRQNRSKEEEAKTDKKRGNPETASKEDTSDGPERQQEGGVERGDKNEPIREKVRSRPQVKPASPEGPELSGGERNNVNPTPEKKDIVQDTAEPIRNVEQK